MTMTLLTTSAFLAKCDTLFKTSLDKAEQLYTLGTVFLVVGLILLIVRMFLTHFAKDQPAPGPRGSMLNPIEWVKAITEFTKAIADAPAPVVMFAMGLVLIWLPYPTPNAECAAVEKAQIEAKVLTERNAAISAVLPTIAPKSVTTVRTAKETKTTAVWSESTSN